MVFGAWASYAQDQTKDSIRLEHNEMLISKDTVYFGVIDPLVMLTSGTEYKIQRNFLMRSNVFYEKKPHKQEQVEERLLLYSELWNKAYSYSVKDTTTKVDNSIANAQMYFKQYEGKVIRSISFSAVDMFDGQVEDTTKQAISNLSKKLNKIHFTTHKNVISKHLRFKENDKIESWKLSENERLLRQLRYIEEARIKVLQENRLSDSVDLIIITQDRFPLGVKMDINDYNEYTLSLYSSNFYGLGDYAETGIEFNGSKAPLLGYNLKYQSYNILGSFINAGAYRISNFEKNNYGVVVERPFLTTDMRFGGAFSFDNIKQTRSYDSEIEDTVLTSPYSSHLYDTWLGKTFVLSSSGERANISMAVRYYDEHYYDRPEVKLDSNLVFHDWKTSISSLMLQKVNYFQTQKLMGFGGTEDVPVGYSLKVTSGYHWNQYNRRPYIGFDLNTQMVRPKSGILRLTSEVGIFYQHENLEDTYGKMNLNYYSPLKQIGRYDMRHMLFASSELLINEHYYNRLRLKNTNIGDIQSQQESNSTLSVMYKPIFHLPTHLLGFKFSVAPFTAIGLASDGILFSGTSHVYSVHGISLRTKNESLIFPTLGMDLRYYPVYGDKNNHVAFEFYARDTRILETIFSPKPKLNRN